MRAATEQIGIVLKELLIHRRYVFIAFLGINAVAIVAGLLIPRSFMSSTTIYVEERNIIEPLMQGAAVATNLQDRARIAREIIMGRRVISQLAQNMGLLESDASDVKQARVIEKLRSQTQVTTVGRGLIRIDFSGGDPDSTYRSTKQLAELFIEESQTTKLQESQSAFEFINNQVQEYHDKLNQAEQQLKNLRSINIESGIGGTETNVVTRINAIRTRIDQTNQDLRENEVRKSSLERQLAGEAETTMQFSRVGQSRTRISELQVQLTTLRQNYHESYPDIVRIRHQIEDLRESIRQEEERRQNPTSSAGQEQRPAPNLGDDEGVLHSPLHQQLRRDLVQIKTTTDTLRARLGELHAQLRTELKRGRDAHSGEAELAEVTRDYQVNSTIYQDLLRRRETAQVSTNLDREKQGLRFRVQEEAVRPTSPTGVRYLYMLFAGLFLSISLPVGVVFGLAMLDQRVRLASSLVERMKVPVLAVVPRMWSPQDLGGVRGELRVAVVGVAGLVLLLMVAIVLRVTQVFG
jgi:polysaccharide chain length determinant protein (PEP-CTERM system associated)